MRQGKTFLSTQFRVSIHAPAWGATKRIYAIADLLLFQSTHPHGVRRGSQYLRAPTHAFQSTHPHGVRRASLASLSMMMLFQSTHPHGVRPSLNTDVILAADVSIHAPAWGATGKYKLGFMFCVVSIHAPAWGATGR